MFSFIAIMVWGVGALITVAVIVMIISGIARFPPKE